METVIEYLQALNNVFELALLGNHVRIFKLEGTTLQRMEKGFNFFKKWCEDAISQVRFLYFVIHLSIWSTVGAFKDGVNDKWFISWQVIISV